MEAQWQMDVAPAATDGETTPGWVGLLVFLPAALAACFIVACPVSRLTLRAASGVSSSIWPDWLPRPKSSTVLAASAPAAEESPLLQSPLGQSQPELLLLVPDGKDATSGTVADALRRVGLLVEPMPLVRTVDAQVLGVWAAPELLERKAEQVQLPVRLHVQHGGGFVPYRAALRPLLARPRLGDFSSLERQVLILGLVGLPHDLAMGGEGAAVGPTPGGAGHELSSGVELARLSHEGEELAAYVGMHDPGEPREVVNGYAHQILRLSTGALLNNHLRRCMVNLGVIEDR